MTKQLQTLQSENKIAQATIEEWYKSDECKLQYSTEQTPEVMAAFEKGQLLYNAKVATEESLIEWLFAYIRTPAGQPKSIIERNTLTDLEKMYRNDTGKQIKIRTRVAELTMKLKM